MYNHECQLKEEKKNIVSTWRRLFWVINYFSYNLVRVFFLFLFAYIFLYILESLRIRSSPSPSESFLCCISLPLSSLSFNGWEKHSLFVAWQAFFPILFKCGVVWFEHRLKYDLKVLAIPCIQYNIWKAVGITKRGCFPVLKRKNKRTLEKTLFSYG